VRFREFPRIYRAWFESKPAQSYQSTGCEVISHPISHRIDRHTVEFNAVRLTAVKYGTERLGDFSAGGVFGMTKNLERL
jgi:hypothetical protein